MSTQQAETNIVPLNGAAIDQGAASEPDTFLTIPRAAALLNEMIDGVTVTAGSVRGMADRDRLPFFKDMATGKRLIRKTDLIFFYTRQASHAARSTTNAINKKAGL